MCKSLRATNFRSHCAAATRARQQDPEDRWAATVLAVTDLPVDSTRQELEEEPQLFVVVADDAVAAAAPTESLQWSVLSCCFLDSAVGAVGAAAAAAAAGAGALV